MSRLVASVRHDVRLQLRNGFYHAAGFVALFMIIGMSWVPSDLRGSIFPPLVLSNLLMGTFYFVAGLVMLEKGEGTIEALVVTPLRDGEYIASKVATLALLGVFENLAIVGIVDGFAFDVPLFIAGILVGAALYVLAGFLLVVRYDALNAMLFPSVLWVVVLSIPFLQYVTTETSLLPLFWLHPLQPSLVLMRAAYEPFGAGTIAAAFVVAVGWLALGFVAARRAYDRYLLHGGAESR